MAVVTISKLYASGGIRLARAVASRLGYRYVDRRSIMRAINDYSVESSSRQTVSETILRLMDRTISDDEYEDNSFISRTDDRAIMELTKELIGLIGQKDDAVIVGWGGQMILHDLPTAVHVRIVADPDDRVRRVMKKDRCSRTQAEDIVANRELQSRRFIEYYWKRNWNDPLLYDVAVNTTHIGVDAGVEMILALLRIKGLGSI